MLTNVEKGREAEKALASEGVKEGGREGDGRRKGWTFSRCKSGTFVCLNHCGGK